MKAPLHLATDADAPAIPETVGQKVRRLQAEAQALASDHVRQLLASMDETAALAREIAEGGGVYHVGAQQHAERVADDLASKLATMRQIVERT